MMFGLGLPELVIVGAVIMLLFGPKIVKRFFTSATETAKEVKKLTKELSEKGEA